MVSVVGKKRIPKPDFVQQAYELGKASRGSSIAHPQSDPRFATTLLSAKARDATYLRDSTLLYNAWYDGWKGLAGPRPVPPYVKD